MKSSQGNTKSTVLFGLCAVAAAFFLVVKPKQDDVEAAKTVLASSTEALNNSRLELAALGPQVDDAELNTLVVQVPRTADTPAFFDQISLIAVQNGVEVTEITFGQPTAAPGSIGSKILVSITANGPRAAIDLFLNSIAELPRLAIIEQANLNPAAVPGQPLGDIRGEVTASLSLVLFTGLAPTTK